MTDLLDINIQSNVKEIQRGLSRIEKDQFPFAFGQALTAVANVALADVRNSMVALFDRPTSYTMKAFYVKPAKKNDRTAWVAAREWSNKGTPAHKYLMPEVFGGKRRLKSFERKLSPISGGQYVIPARGAKLDAYGNVSKGQIVKVLSRLNMAESSAGYKANISDDTTRKLQARKRTVAASGHRSDFFVARSKHGGDSLGIYQLKGKGRVEPIFIFTKKPPSYSARFPFHRIVESSVARNFNYEMQKAMDHALATAH